MFRLLFIIIAGIAGMLYYKAHDPLLGMMSAPSSAGHYAGATGGMGGGHGFSGAGGGITGGQGFGGAQGFMGGRGFGGGQNSTESLGGVPGGLATPDSAEAKEKRQNAVLLMDAAAKGDKAKTERLLGGAIEVDGRDADRRTALMYAAWNGHDDICGLLLASGANIRFLDRSGHGALDYAGSRGLVNTVDFLLKRSHLADSKHDHSYAQLMQATYAQDASHIPPDAADIINRLSPDGASALHVAAGSGAAPVLEALFSQGADAALANDEYQTPLHWAAWGNQPASIALLVQHGANVNARDLAGTTPLMLAAQNHAAAAVTALLEQGARPEQADKQGKTALMMAEDKHDKAIAALLQ